MNIFVTSLDPVESAQNLDIKRVNKMLIESYQVLSTALHKNGAEPFYRVTHQNHPCVIWAAESSLNYQWLLRHAVALSDVYTSVSDKIHKCQRDALAPARKGLEFMYQAKGDVGLTSFVNCTNFKQLEITLAYKACLLEKWKNDKRSPAWPHREDCYDMIGSWGSELYQAGHIL